MTLPEQATVLRELDAALTEVQRATQGLKHDDFSDLKDFVAERLLTRVVATIERFAVPGSYYLSRIRDIREGSGLNARYSLRLASGVLHTLRDDTAAGRTESVLQLVHAEMFADFLEMAEYLADNGFKDGAAVIVGSALEAHIRAMCKLYGIATDDGTGRHKKADTLNAELDKAGAYRSKLELKSVTAWLDLRNKAAHGEYDKYDVKQVSLLIASIRDFMLRYPA